MQQTENLPGKSSLDGLWVVLGAQAKADESRLPIMARAGDDQCYLLGFKNVAGARQFVQAAGVEDAEPRMVVKGNRGDLIRVAQEHGAAGLLVDYDVNTQQYAAADRLY